MTGPDMIIHGDTPDGTDVRVRTRNGMRNYRVAPDRTVYAICDYRNFQGHATASGVPPGGAWRQYRRIADQAGEAAQLARKSLPLVG